MRTAIAKAVATVDRLLTAQKHALYGVAVTRVVLGFVVWSQLVLNWSDRHYTWGDGAKWTAPVQDASAWSGVFGAFDQLSGTAFDLAYLATIGFGVLMMLGVYSRAATVLTLVMWMSLYVTNPFVGSGGDAVLRMVLLYMCFTDSGRFLAVDARRARSRGEVRPLVPAWFSTTLHNLAIILIVHQVVMVYVGSAFWKVKSEKWLDGTATYYPLQTEAYSPWLDLIDPVSQNATVIALATWSAIVVQLMFPVMMLYRPTRILGLVTVTGMHLGIGLFMGIMFFSLVMIAVDMMLVSDATWAGIRRWARTGVARFTRSRMPGPR